MKIRLPASELIYALTGLGRVMARRATLPALGTIRLQSDRMGVVLMATDLDAHVAYTCGSAELVDPGPAVLLGHKRLKDLVGASRRDEVEIEAAGDHQVRIGLHGPLGDREQFLPVIDPEEWPPIPKAVPTAPADPGFLGTYRKLLPFASRDETRAILTGVCIDVQGGNHTLVATDGRRMTSFNSLSLPIGETCIVPTHKLLAWPKLGGECAIGLSRDGRFGLQSGPWAFQARAIEGTYPNWRQVVPSHQEPATIALADEDLPVLEDAFRTLPGGGDDTKAVVLTHEGERLWVAAQDAESERWSKRALTHSTWNGNATGIAVSRTYLADAVRAGFRRFEVGDELSPLKADDGNGGLHVLMPLRTEMPTNLNPPKPPAKPASPASPASPPKNPEKSPAAPANHPEPTRRKTPMPEKTQKTDELAAFAELQAAAGEVKTKLQEARAAAARVTVAAKAAMKEARQQRAEVEAARATLTKLKAIDL